MKNIKSSSKKRLKIWLSFLGVIFFLTGMFLCFINICSAELKQHDVLSVCESVPEPVFSVPEGIYDHPFELEIITPPDYDVFYTTDGSTPTVRSPKYKNRIHVNPRINLNKNILYISTSPLWKPPSGRQNHFTVIRARCFRAGMGYGPVKNIVYSTSDIDQHSGFHIIHLLIEADSLFSPKKGIYVMGEKFYSKKAIIAIEDKLKNIKWNRYPANYRERGRGWIRHGAAFILMNQLGETVFEQNINLRISANTSMAFPCKPLRILPDNINDTIIGYHFFDELTYPSYRILLRNSGNDATRTYFRDALMNQLAKGTKVDTRAYVPSVVYINGNYWGIHNIRERNDEYFLATRYATSLQNITRFTYRRPFEVELNYDKHLTIRHGNESARELIVNLMNYIKNNSMSDHDAYNFASAQIDVDNFIDYVILETFFANQGWARTNIKFYRFDSQTDFMKEKGIDAGKLRWFFDDLDNGMDSTVPVTINMFDMLREGFANDIVTQIFFSFMENIVFKEKFLSRYEYLVKNHLTTEKMLEQINLFETRYYSEIRNHIARWRGPHNLQFWQQEIEFLKKFSNERQDIVLEQIKSL